MLTRLPRCTCSRPCASQKTGSVARGALPSAGQPHGSQSSSSFRCSRPELKGRSSLVSCVAAGCCRPLKVERRSGQLLQLLALQLLLTCCCCL